MKKRGAKFYLSKRSRSSPRPTKSPLIPYRRALDLISLDFAIETLLYAVVSALDSTGKTPRSTLTACSRWRIADLPTEKLGPLPLRTRVLRLHDLRNDAQHKRSTRRRTN
jgi:hypothetical protein